MYQSCRLLGSQRRVILQRISFTNQRRFLSTESSPAFQYPKAEELFNKITTKCSREEVIMLSDEIMRCLGRSFRQNEFYYKGFGGKQVKGGAASAEAAAPVEEKTKFDLKLAGFDEKAKIKVIKEIRSIAGLGLKEAKELVESAPKVIQKDLKKEDAEALKTKLEEIGAQVELV